MIFEWRFVFFVCCLNLNRSLKFEWMSAIWAETFQIHVEIWVEIFQIEIEIWIKMFQIHLKLWIEKFEIHLEIWIVWKLCKPQALLAITQNPLVYLLLFFLPNSAFLRDFCLFFCFFLGPLKPCFLANEVSSSRGRRLWGRGSTQGIGWATTRHHGTSWSGQSLEFWNSGSLGSPMYEIISFFCSF